MSAEAIYNLLELDAEADKHTPKETNHIRHEKMDKVDLPDENPMDAMHEQAIEKIKQQGDLPLGIEIVVPKVFEGQISWRDELFTVIENSFKFDYRLSPPNKRYLSKGVALPSLSGEIMQLIVCIDSSGSIDEELLGVFLSEVESIMNSFENFVIDLLIADAKVQEHHILYPGDSIEYTIKGGGGTRFDTTFSYIYENINTPKLVLYFTDGFGTYGEDEPDYDVVWVLSKDGNKNIPFGRTIQL
jgi:predicted metal-dependent peptidase